MRDRLHRDVDDVRAVDVLGRVSYASALTKLFASQVLKIVP